MKILAIIFAIICAMQAVVNFVVGNYVTASIMVVCTAINIYMYANLRKVM
jgi:hypothetical protein